MNESDITFEDGITVSHLDIIESQLQLIATVENINDEMYDQLQEHKIRAINNAFIIIHSCQFHIFNMIK